MILACPLCQTRYLIPATVFAQGPRMVRCAKCSNSWSAQPPNEIDVIGSVPPLPPSAFEPARPPAPESTAEKSTETITEAAAGSSFGSAFSSSAVPLSGTPPPLPPPIPPGSNLPVPHKEPMPIWLRRAVMAGGILAVTALLWLILDRKDIVEQWPVTRSLYDRVGLHAYSAGEGLSLDNVRSELKYEDSIMQLVVQGTITNTTDDMQTIPNLNASAMGTDGEIMQSWQIDAPAATLAPHESAPFKSSINAPKGTVANVNLNFIELKNGDQ